MKSIVLKLYPFACNLSYICLSLPTAVSYSSTMEKEAIQALVQGLLSTLGVAIDDVAVSSGPRTVVAVSSGDSKTLIGPHGEHLRALNHLARKLAEKQAGTDVSFVIDVGGYLEAELDRIRSNARLLAQRARLFKHEVELGPMTAYERLVIHELFQDDPEIETESRGEGKFRHIVLKYVEQPSASVPEL